MFKKYIKIGIIITLIAGTGIFYSCQKDHTLNRSLDNISHPERKEKTFELKKLSNGSWRWAVYCDGVFKEGSIENTRRQAKRAIKNVVCSLPPSSKNIYVTLMIQDSYNLQGNINALIANGRIEYLDEINPWTNTFHRFTRNDISPNVLSWLSEIYFYDETLSRIDELVAAQLKVWGVYLGGNSVSEIISLHNLTVEQFNAIASNSWNEITLKQTTNENGTVHLDWNFKY
jgi:hypothetical protein